MASLSKPARAPQADPAVEWWRGAAIYQIYPRSFMDANGDGVLDAQDRAARGEAMFARADTNGDGELTIAEMQAAREARKAERKQRREQRRGQ